jgi:PAS domain S-box-containing protein
MRQGGVTPTGVERRFDEHEIIVSKTDPKGVITYANDVFRRVSGYSEHEIIGKPHSLIRHPDMPRVIFAVLWETLKAGQEIFAYVDNLAADGANYWVFAHVTPSYDAAGRLVGYHSNRRVPDRPAVAAVSALYRTLLVAERRHPRPADAIVASRAVLEAALAERGQTYDQFVWALAGQGVR